MDGIQQIGSESWTRFAEPPSTPVDPFLTYPFLKALEDSGSVGASAGWVPYHLQVKDAEGALAGCHAALPEGSLAGRVYFRLQLGRCV